MPLKNRQMQIPGGLRYRQSETGWQSSRFASFDQIVSETIDHRMGNPYLIQKNGWSVDRATVEMEVDNYNTAFCRAMGGQWLQYVEGGPDLAPPFPVTPQLGPYDKLRAVAGGARANVQFLDSREEAVAPELANKRAGVCCGTLPDGSDKCPMNQEGDWTRFFTAPVAVAIKAQLERRKQMNLATRYDDRLGTCDACLCPMKLKVHFPLHIILKNITAESKALLDPRCWILAEEKGQ